jgi:uncharacterized SAM-binding protein YcdF (DUF218 family)
MTTAARIIRDITSFIFLEDEPAGADIIMIPGSGWPQMSERAAALYKAGYAPLILPSGKHSYKRDRFDGPKSGQDRYPGVYATEWEFERDVLIRSGVPEQAILREDMSGHTVENAFFSKRAVDGAGIPVKRAILCCKAYHARRSLMTYAWAFPGVDFVVCPVETQGIGRDSWHLSVPGREKVLSEVSKCGAYFKDAVDILAQSCLSHHHGDAPR